MRPMSITLGMVLLIAGCGKDKSTSTVTPTTGRPSIVPVVGAAPAPAEENYIHIKPRSTFLVKEWAKDSYLSRLLLSADGKRLAVALHSERTQVWDLTGEPKKLNEFPGKATALSPDGKRYICFDRGKMIVPEVIDCDTGAIIATLEFTGLLFHPCYFPSANELTLVYPGGDEREEKNRKANTLKVHTFTIGTARPTAQFEIPNFVNGTHLVQLGLKGGKELAISNQKTGDIQFWDIGQQKMIRELKLTNQPLKNSSTFVISSDANWVLGSIGNGTEVFDGTTGTPVAAPPPFDMFHVLVPNQALTLSSYTKTVKGQVEKGYHVIDIRKKKITSTLATSGTNAKDFSADGTVFITATDKGEMALFDLTKLSTLPTGSPR